MFELTGPLGPYFW